MEQRNEHRRDGNVGQGATAPLAAVALEQTQIAKYHTRGGTGFAAEDANNLADRLRGKDAQVVGQSNALHGADRLVDGVRVQSKYYRTPAETVRSAFDPNGTYRYAGQVLEVPKEQYDQCVALMRERIGRGQVPGHTDPADAELLVKKGTVTYKQARNIARAGNIDSVRFDVQTGAAVSSGVFGLSFAINYWQGRRHGLSGSDAIRTAFREALCVGAATLVTHVVGAQLLRTRAAAWGTVAVRPGVRAAARTALGKEVVEGIATASLGKAVHGAAAVNHVSKLLRSNAVTGGVMAAVACAPDFYRAAFDESISWKQFTKNSMVNVAGVAGGVAGWMGGAAAGAAIGSVVPVVGTAVGGVVGGLLGSLGGGAAAGKLTQSVADGMVEDDADALLKVLEKELQKLSQEYMLDKPEIKQVLAEVRATADANWLRRMYKKTGGRKAQVAASCGRRSNGRSRKSPSAAGRWSRPPPSAFTARYGNLGESRRARLPRPSEATGCTRIGRRASFASMPKRAAKTWIVYRPRAWRARAFSSVRRLGAQPQPCRLPERRICLALCATWLPVWGGQLNFRRQRHKEA